jgi:ankyrin repeat protein
LTSRKFREDERDLIKKIEKTIKDSSDVIKELQDECGKFTKDSRHGFKDAIKVAGRRAAYPYRGSTLHKLDEDVEALRENVSMALAVLQSKDSMRIQHDIEDSFALLELVRASQISSSVRDWLKAPDATVNYNAVCTKRHPGTGKWLIKSDTYTAWLTGRNSFLWLSGFAGSGKSVLCSTAIQHIFRHRKSDPRIGIGFFYFTFNDESKKDESAMLRALLLQLSNQRQDGYKDLTSLCESYSAGTPPPYVLLDCLRRLIQRFDQVYLMLDALDESPRNGPRERVLDVLEEIKRWGQDSVHLLVTSRDHWDIRESLNPTSIQQVTMRNVGIEEDIASYVLYQLTEDRRLERWQQYREKIQETLVKGAKGVYVSTVHQIVIGFLQANYFCSFRWVECQLKSLYSCPCSEAHLDQLLQSLPPTLDETYERMLCNIDNFSAADARRILTMLCFAARPLTVPELIEGIAVDIKGGGGLDRKRRLQDAKDIERICLGLVEIDMETLSTTGNSSLQIVRIAHFSVQEYLESERIHQRKAAAFGLRSIEAHTEMSQICLLYLLEPSLSSTPLDRAVLKEYKLAEFAAEYWYYHYQQAQRPSEVNAQILKLFQQQDSFTTWVRLHEIDSGLGFWRNDLDCPSDLAVTPVYCASYLGLNQVLLNLIDGKEENNRTFGVVPYTSRGVQLIDAKGGKYGNPLQAASYKGHETIVRLLVGKDVDVNYQSGQFGNALQAASYEGHEMIVRLLLKKGADVNTHGGKYGNALQAASSRGYETIVLLLLENGADVNAQSGEYGNALQAALSGGHESVVRLLLENGANVDAQCGEYSNVLQAALCGGHESVVRFLLEKGADVNTQCGAYGNLLQAASHQGYQSLVQLLLEKGANVDAKGGKYGSALQAALYRGHESIIQQLLGTGPDVEAQREALFDALEEASDRGHEHVVRLILKKGTTFIPQGRAYWVALHRALCSGHETVARFLLEKGADANTRGGEFDNVLQTASFLGHDKIVRLLLENGADVNTQGGKYGNALRAAFCGGCETVVLLLLETVRMSTTNSESLATHYKQHFVGAMSQYFDSFSKAARMSTPHVARTAPFYKRHPIKAVGQ